MAVINAYIFEDELNSNVQVVIKAYSQNGAWELLSFVVKNVDDFKLRNGQFCAYTVLWHRFNVP